LIVTHKASLDSIRFLWRVPPQTSKSAAVGAVRVAHSNAVALAAFDHEQRQAPDRHRFRHQVLADFQLGRAQTPSADRRTNAGRDLDPRVALVKVENSGTRRRRPSLQYDLVRRIAAKPVCTLLKPEQTDERQPAFVAGYR